MAADSDGLVETVLTCEGDLSDPHFPRRFKKLLTNLKKLLFKGSTDGINLQKVEPWNSVRVTFTIPKEAAVRLRQLAQQGNATLLQLGILSVQVEGDEIISLRMANRYGGEAQEIVMHTGAAGPSTSSSLSSSSTSLSLSSPEHSSEASNVIRSIAQSLSQLPGTSGSTSAFKSPNVVAPLDSDPIPLPPTPSLPSSPAHYHGPPFPFASMTHAAHAIHSRETLIPPPPPYPGPSRSLDPKPLNQPPNVALSSPLLVNLLQNDGFAPSSATTTGKSSTPVKPKPAPKSEPIPNSTFFNTKLPESSVHLPNPSLSQIHSASPNSQIHVSNFNPQVQPSNPISTQIHVATNPNSSQILLSNPNSSQIHIGNPNSSQIHKTNPSTTQIHLANSNSPQIHSSNSFPNSSQTHTANPNSTPSFLVSPNHNPVSLAQPSKSSPSPFLTKQSVVNQALYTRQFHQSVSSQTPLMRSHSQTSNSLANSISHPQPNSIHPQLKSESQIRFPPTSLSDPLPVAKHTPPSVLPPPPPSLLPPPSNIIRSDIQSPIERPPQSHQQTMVEAKDFTPPPPPKLPSEISHLTSPVTSVPIPPPPHPSHAVKTDHKLTRSDHNKTENVKFSETSQPSHLSSKKQPVMLINPLTGDLEPIPSEVEEVDSTHLSLVNSLDDPFFSFPSPLNDPTNSLFSDDDDVNSILNKKTESAEASESESSRLPSSDSRNIQQQVNEKIKLRLKLEKSEPVMPVYKSDISFVQGVRKIRPSGTSLSSSSTSVSCNTSSISSATSTVTPPEAMSSLSSDSGTSLSTNPEEPKVPPLHISLRGRNAAVVVNCKDEKKWKDGFKAAASGVKKANKLTAGSSFKENANFVKKNLVFVQQFAEENEEEVEDEEESEDEEEDDDEEEEEDEEQDGEDTEEDDDEENDEEDEDNKRDVEQNMKSRLEPGEIVSPYSTPIRTAYPTAEEVTSILRSMPSDTHHKMSLSFPKEVKKKESIKKQLHQRLVEGPLSLFHKNTKSKTKSSNSLLKNVVKRAKEARMLSAVRHSTDKQRPVGNGVQRKSSSEKETSPTATQSPGGPTRKFKSSRQQTSNESSKTIVPLNHNSTDVVKKFVNNVNKLCNVKNKDNSVRSKDNVINSLTSYSNIHSTIVHTVTNASTSNSCSFNKSFTQTNSQNKKLKDFHLLNDKDLVSFNKTGLKSISSLLNNTLEPFTKLENSSVLLPIIHDIELTEKKIKQKMLESEKAQQLQQLQQEQQMMSFSETNVKSIATSTVLDCKSDNTRNSTESIRQDNFRSSTENNVNQSEPGNSQGEDSGIESMDALSEKSPNQSSESPLYKNNEKDDKPTVQSINSLHGVKQEKIGRTSYIDTQMLHVQSVKRESVDAKSDSKSEVAVHVKKEPKELCSDGVEDNKADVNRQPGKVSNQELEKLDKDKVLVDLKDAKTENVNSPASEDPQPIRITPALYTYSNSEKVREDTPSPNLMEEDEDDQSGGSTLIPRPKRKRKLDGTVTTSAEQTQQETLKSDLTEAMKQISPMNSKSLLEQLLIEIPSETRVEPRRSMTTRNTRSQNKFCDMSPEVPTSASSTSSASSRTPHSSPSLSEPPPSSCKPSPNNSKPRAERGKSKRSNTNSVVLATSTSSNNGSNPAETNSSDESNTARPNKRKCSENAAELIKACMGVEDHFHATGKKQHFEPSGLGMVATPTTSPPGKTLKKKGTDADSDNETTPLSDTLVKHKSCDNTVKTPSCNSIISQPVTAGDKQSPPASVALSSPPLSSSSTSSSTSTPSVSSVLSSSTAANASPLVRTSSRINESKTGSNNRRSNRQNKAANDNPMSTKKAAPSGNNNNKSACGLLKNNNCITRGASKVTASDDTVATVRRKTRSANVHDSELGPGKRRRSSKDSK